MRSKSGAFKLTLTTDSCRGRDEKERYFSIRDEFDWECCVAEQPLSLPC